MTTTARVLVVGAGPSGLVALKELIEHGIEATCIELEDDIGGAFYHRPGAVGVYESTLLTVSNAFMAYSSLPLRETETRRFWHHTEYWAYLDRFTRTFGLREHIRFGVRLVRVEREGSGARVTLADQAGQWTEDWRAVVLCTGTNRVPRLPEIDGLDTFPGEVLHGARYESAEPLRGKRVVCMGLGETGADVAHEVAEVGESVLLSLRRYPAIVQRFPRRQHHPSDAYTCRALYRLGREYMQRLAVERAIGGLEAGADGEDRVLLDWMVRSGGLFGQWLTKNDAILPDVASGRLATDFSGVSHIEGSEIVFNSGRRYTADALVCCTGYRESFPIEGVDVDNVRDLWMHMFHPQLGSAISLIGWARPELGGSPTCSELQARYLAMILAGERPLPSPDRLEALAREDRAREEKHFAVAPSPPSVVAYVDYCDRLADLIGCHPLRGGRVHDPALLMRLWFGSLVSAQYRLVGPCTDPVRARETVMRWPNVMRRREMLSFTWGNALRRMPGVASRLARRNAARANAAIRGYVRAHGGMARMADPTID